jgi:hypothetical protein
MMNNLEIKSVKTHGHGLNAFNHTERNNTD